MRKTPPASRMKTGTRTRGSPRAIVLELRRSWGLVLELGRLPFDAVFVAAGRNSPRLALLPFLISAVKKCNRCSAYSHIYKEGVVF